jgi:tRNA uridine 5-carbamoylmethylation protein Kti12
MVVFVKYLTLLSGISASGKSTLAQKLLVGSRNTIRVNKDALRSMMYMGVKGPNEKFIRAVEFIVAGAAAVTGKNIIVDDTNLTADDVSDWHSFAKRMHLEFNIAHQKVDPKEAIRRDSLRANPVGAAVIRHQATILKGAKRRGSR